jgi:superfamily II DNA or RNA helicase/HKD family nuclease
MHHGLYDQLLSEGLQSELSQLADPRLYSLANVDPEDAHNVLAQFLEHGLAKCLAMYRGADAAERQQRLVARIIAAIAADLGPEQAGELSIASPLKRLLAIYSSLEVNPPERPDTPLARSALLTGTRQDPSLGSQLKKELATANRVDILCSFIKWSGLRILLDDLKELVNRPSTDGLKIRVITTSYMGATDARAVDAIAQLPNTEVRVSYDTKRTRLHAKAYLFHRDSGFGSAYVGSANISHAALSEGLEWTTKISHFELPYLWSKLTGTFETYWADDEFQAYDSAAPERLCLALQKEQANISDTGLGVTFDLRPYPFQEEILDVLAAERAVQNKFRHLVVAATGTGKTMIAAFDYARACKARGTRLPLLFVAHREEILKQALGTFRAVLRDHNFGDLLVGGREPAQTQYLFCSIQIYCSRNLDRRPSDAYHYVVVDEFHHAAAPSYSRLLEHINPSILVGLTATPERSDQLDVLRWFGGHSSAEVRLPDAINRRLLCPFQYFGVTDSVDLNALTWQRGGYSLDELDRLYTGNDARALLIFDKVNEIVLDPHRARGLGFCVSVAHANFMARFFSENGIPATVLTGATASDVRHAAQQQLRSRVINFLFVVDLYNEGVDIPEVDTVLFLRPTESLTVYLQQFGRGLRLHEDKQCLTVLDFIGAQRQEFRFAAQFRAMSARPTLRLDQEIEQGFPHLPSGCVVRLERVAQQHVLENVRASIRLFRPKIVGAIRELDHYLGHVPSLAETLDYLDTSLDELLKRGLWSQLLADAGQCPQPTDPNQDRLAKGLRRISQVNCSHQIGVWQNLLSNADIDLNAEDERLIAMLHVTLWDKESLGWTPEMAAARFRENPAALRDLQAILAYRLAHAPALDIGQLPDIAGPLMVHAQYTRDEILVGLGHWTLSKRPDQREGVLHLSTTKVDAFFVTLQKTEEEYSPTTMYEDYLISHDLFHWQSQSNTSAKSKTGQRYIHHESLGYTPLLFVRETRKLPSDLTAPYTFLGPCSYVSHTGTRPMSIIWKLRHPVPARLYREMARQAAV